MCHDCYLWFVTKDITILASLVLLYVVVCDFVTGFEVVLTSFNHRSNAIDVNHRDLFTVRTSLSSLLPGLFTVVLSHP